MATHQVKKATRLGMSWGCVCGLVQLINVVEGHLSEPYLSHELVCGEV